MNRLSSSRTTTAVESICFPSSHQQHQVAAEEQQDEERDEQKSGWTPEESLIISIPGICHPIHAFFPPFTLSKCQLCKDRFIDRDTCRITLKHTRLPWNNTCLCITIDSSAFVVIDGADDEDEKRSTSINDEVCSSSTTTPLACRRRLLRDEVYVAKPSSSSSFAAATNRNNASTIHYQEPRQLSVATECSKKDLFYFNNEDGGKQEEVRVSPPPQQKEQQQQQHEPALGQHQQHHSKYAFTQTSEILMGSAPKTRMWCASSRRNEGERVLLHCNKDKNKNTTIVTAAAPVNSTSSMNTQIKHKEPIGACISCSKTNYSRNKCRRTFKHTAIPHNTIHLTLYVATTEERAALKKLCLQRQETTNFLHFESKREVYDVESAEMNLKELERNDSFCLGLDDSNHRPSSDTFFVSLFRSASNVHVEWLDLFKSIPLPPAPKNNNICSTSAVYPAATYEQQETTTIKNVGGSSRSSVLSSIRSTKKNNNMNFPILLVQGKDEGRRPAVVDSLGRNKKRIRGQETKSLPAANTKTNNKEKQARINGATSTIYSNTTTRSKRSTKATTSSSEHKAVDTVLVGVIEQEGECLERGNADGHNSRRRTSIQNNHMHKQVPFERSAVASLNKRSFETAAALPITTAEKYQLLAASLVPPGAPKGRYITIETPGSGTRNWFYRQPIPPCPRPLRQQFLQEHLSQDSIIRNNSFLSVIVSQNDSIYQEQSLTTTPMKGDEEYQQQSNNIITTSNIPAQEVQEIEQMYWENKSVTSGQDDYDDELRELEEQKTPVASQMINNNVNKVTPVPAPTAVELHSSTLEDDCFISSSWMRHIEDFSLFLFNDNTLTGLSTSVVEQEQEAGPLDGVLGSNDALVNLLLEDEGGAS